METAENWLDSDAMAMRQSLQRKPHDVTVSHCTDPQLRLPGIDPAPIRLAPLHSFSFHSAGVSLVGTRVAAPSRTVACVDIRSPHSFEAQRLHGIDLERALRRQIAGDGRDGHEHQTDTHERQRVGRADTEEQRTQQPRGGQ